MNDLPVWQAAVLGAVQGLSEFLPISSSAHLSLAPWVLGWEPPGLAFDVALHVGTLVAVLWYFRAEWFALARAGGRILRTRRVTDEHERRAVLLVLGTIPAGVGGYLLNDYAETVFRAPALTATMLIAMGAVLWLVDKYAPSTRALASFGVRDALIVGASQVVAMIPGVSRSGATITAGRALGGDRASAAVFSFLLSMPITAAAAVYKVPDAIAQSERLAPLAVGVAAAAISGWLAIAALLKFIRTRGYGAFAGYRLVLGLAIFALLASRA